MSLMQSWCQNLCVSKYNVTDGWVELFCVGFVSVEGWYVEGKHIQNWCFWCRLSAQAFVLQHKIMEGSGALFCFCMNRWALPSPIDEEHWKVVNGEFLQFLYSETGSIYLQLVQMLKLSASSQDNKWRNISWALVDTKDLNCKCSRYHCFPVSCFCFKISTSVQLRLGQCDWCLSGIYIQWVVLEHPLPFLQLGFLWLLQQMSPFVQLGLFCHWGETLWLPEQ